MASAPSSIKISIVIPAYNEEGYIGTCLDAIMTEIGARRDVEVIVVDNNSNDHTDAIIARYPNVILLREPRRGANRARQTGIEAAHGEFIALPDADTKMPKGWLAKASGYLEADPHLACISGPFIYFDLPRWTHYLVRFFYYIGFVLQMIMRALTGKSNVVQGGNYMVRREALMKAGGLNVNLTFYGDDTDLALRLSTVGKVKFTFKLPMPVSGRRLAKEGTFTMGIRYAMNNFWIVLFGRPFTLSAKEVRLSNGDGGSTIVYEPENRAKEVFIAVMAALFFVAVLAVIIVVAYYLVQFARLLS